MAIPADVDAYIGAFPADTQAQLKKLRAAIRRAAPRAEETISYNMPAYVVDGKKIVWFAGFKAHIGFYPGAAAVAAFKKDLARYKQAKGSVQFPLSERLPLDLVARIVKYRLRES
ncbi:MAG TPA: DUF1801 domain-containing protein [Candidatus Baltobacteraceae bacterium]|jgi:uncharacterized protein YdhG (YjbR/CyaY superfamily)|nr:DUF1801 domain-containing protein [Candidatus Baltobacteraceae bacterium]